VWQAVFGGEREMDRLHAALEQDGGTEPVSLRDFQEQVKAEFPAFENLYLLACGSQ
jgi:hypothetical protein